MPKMISILLGVMVLLSSCSSNFFSPTKDFSNLYKQNVEAVVEVVTFKTNEKTGEKERLGIGTGWFFKDRFIITAAHVLGGATSMNGIPISAKVSGNDYPQVLSDVKIVFINEAQDVAILEMPQSEWQIFKSFEAPTNLKIEKGRTPKPGDFMWGIGNRSGFLFHFYNGFVSMTNQPNRGEESIVHFVDSGIIPGDSGGPVFNERGEVIGMAEAYLNLNNPARDTNIDNIDIIVTSDVIRKALRDYQFNDAKPYNAKKKGTNYGEDSFRAEKRTLIVNNPDSAVWMKKLGLKKGDSNIVAYVPFSVKLNDPTHVFIFLNSIAKNDVVKFEWLRDGVKMTGEVKFDY